MSSDSWTGEDDADQTVPDSERLMALSYQAVTGTKGPMAMQIQGLIAGKKAILIDSASP
jgi:hypothetical protein